METERAYTFWQHFDAKRNSKTLKWTKSMSRTCQPKAIRRKSGHTQTFDAQGNPKVDKKYVNKTLVLEARCTTGQKWTTCMSSAL